VDDVILVHVADSLEGLAEKPEGFGFCEGGFGVLVVEKIPIFCEVHNHINAIIF